MKPMRTTVLCLLLLSSAVPGAPEALPGARPGDVGLSSDRLERLRRFVAGEIREGHISGAVSLVARRGKVAYIDAQGMADIESASPMREDAVFRIASMTKPIVSLGALMLYEEGRLLLDNPVSRFLPELAHPRVAVESEGTVVDPERIGTVPAARDITIYDLLTHRSGLTYGFINQGPVGELYRRAQLERPMATTEELVRRLAELPLAHEPGTQFEYSRATDVLGRVIEVVTGQNLDVFLRERILDPLGMKDTRFYLTEGEAPRLVTLYERAPEGELRPVEVWRDSPHVRGPKTFFSGGGGLVSTTADYARFLQMLLDGGELDGTRLVSPKTVELMTADHVGADIPIYPGYGFGLGVAVQRAVGRGHVLSSEGDYTWGGIFNTVFWVDPSEELFLLFMTNVSPYDLDQRWYIKTLVYQAIVD